MNDELFDDLDVEVEAAQERLREAFGEGLAKRSIKRAPPQLRDHTPQKTDTLAVARIVARLKNILGPDPYRELISFASHNHITGVAPQIERILFTLAASDEVNNFFPPQVRMNTKINMDVDETQAKLDQDKSEKLHDYIASELMANKRSAGARTRG